MWFTYSTSLIILLSYSFLNEALLSRPYLDLNNEGGIQPRSLGEPHLDRKLFSRKISDANSNPKVLSDLHSLAGCPGEICGTLSGDAVQPLLAGAPECAQQDMADRIITAAKSSQIKDSNVKSQMIQLAITYRKTERNTFPDFSHQPSIDRNSLYCQKLPKNEELKGIVQVQSSTADPDLFFDPKSTNGGGTVKKGTDPRTIPFGKKDVATSSESNGTSTMNTTTTATSDQGTESPSDSQNTTSTMGTDNAMTSMMNSTNTSSIPITTAPESSPVSTTPNIADDDREGEDN